jgi:hypothetical protein
VDGSISTFDIVENYPKKKYFGRLRKKYEAVSAQNAQKFSGANSPLSKLLAKVKVKAAVDPSQYRSILLGLSS